MPNIQRSVLVPYSNEKMFALVNDIAAYAEYMPGCHKATIIQQTDKEVIAELVLEKAGIQQKFTTRNTLNPPLKMQMSLVDGPFTQFDGEWTFQALDENACKVSLDLTFVLNNPLLSMTVGPWIEKTAAEQVNAVQQRAEKIYRTG